MGTTAEYRYDNGTGEQVGVGGYVRDRVLPKIHRISAVPQCQRAWAQRNHIACCYHAGLAIKVHATNVKQTLYQAKKPTLISVSYARIEATAYTCTKLRITV